MALVNSEFLPRQDSTMSSNVRKLQNAMNFMFGDKERRVFVSALNEYHLDRDVIQFLRKLKFVLNSSEKQQLLPLIRKVIPQSDVETFDLHVQDGRGYGTLPVRSRSRHRQIPDNFSNKEFLLRQRQGEPSHLSAANSALDQANERSNRKPRRKKKPLKKHQDKLDRSGTNSNTSTLTKSSTISQSLYGSRSSLQPNENEIIHIHIGQTSSSQEGFGFSIRGGSQYGLGIYVSMVDRGSRAERQGLQAGDLLLEVNDITFKHISHEEAAKIIRSARRLDVVICRVGRIPGSYEVHQMYQWVDPFGKPVVPPRELEIIRQAEAGTLGKKTGFMMLKNSDERKVTVIVDKGQRLGLMIRGGLEFALGIYVSSVDQQSVAEQAGIKVGDQILNVNGYSFLDISHAEAVHILKTSSLMIMTIKDVGKLPYTRSKLNDHTNWINGISRSVCSSRASVCSSQRTSSTLKANGFSAENGSQRSYGSSTHSQLSSLEEAAKHELNSKDQQRLYVLLKEYQLKKISIGDLVMALRKLLNTHSKFSLMTVVRTLIIPADLDRFDILVHERKARAEKARPQDMMDTVILSRSSSIQSTKKKRAPPPPNQITVDDLESLCLAIEDTADVDPLPDDLPQDETLDFPLPEQNMSHLLSSSSSSTLTDTDIRSSPIMHFANDPLPKMESMVKYNERRRGSTDSCRTITEIEADGRRSPMVNYSLGRAVEVDSVPSPRQQKERILSGRSSPVSGISSHSHHRKRHHKNMQDVKRNKQVTEDMLSPPYLRSSDDVRVYSPTYHRSADDLRALEENFLLRRGTNIDSITTRALVHHIPKDNHPSDDSGVEVNGGHQEDNPLELVTISENTVDIDDALSARSSTSSRMSSESRSCSRSPVPKQSSKLHRQPKALSMDQSLHPNWEAKSEERGRKSSTKPKLRSRSLSLPPETMAMDDSSPEPIKHSSSGNTSSFLSNLASRIQGRMGTPYVERSKKFQSSRTRSKLHDWSADFEAGNIEGKGNTQTQRRGSRVIPPRSRSPLPFRKVSGHSSKESVLIAKAKEKYGDIHLEIVSVHKTKPTLGLAIEGGVNTRQPIPKVINIQPGGSAHESGQLKVGHVILEVNGQSLAGMQHIEAAKTIAEAFKHPDTNGLELLVTDHSIDTLNV